MKASGDEALRQRLVQRAAQVDAKVAYGVVPLDGGEPICMQGDACMPTASPLITFVP